MFWYFGNLVPGTYCLTTKAILPFLGHFERAVCIVEVGRFFGRCIVNELVNSCVLIEMQRLTCWPLRSFRACLDFPCDETLHQTVSILLKSVATLH